MTKRLEDIEVGDRVWVRRGQYGRDIRRVERLTPKQIILNGLIEYSRFERGKPSRYSSSPEPTYYQIGGSPFSRESIEAIATPEECAEWDAQQKRRADEEEGRRRERTAREAKRDALTALFNSERVWVSESGRNLAGEWMLNIYCSEDELQRLAEATRKVIA